MVLSMLDSPIKNPSQKAYRFFIDFPEVFELLEQAESRGDFSGEYTPSIVEIKYSGLTYIRYEEGKLAATRECSEGYIPPFWEVCFDEEEVALFVLGDGEVLLDRTGNMAELDLLMSQCSFLNSPE